MPPNTNQCNFTIPANSNNGGRLTGDGFNGVPTLQNGDTLQVIVRWAGNNPPQQINGYTMITPSGGSSESSPSPFLTSGNFVCYLANTIGKDANTPSYTFPPLTYNGGEPGSYELTFVAEVTSGSTTMQWSEDPEFETGN
jgi:hypothetical protein